VDGVEWILAQDGYEIVPGVSMIHTPGHTLGHMSVQLNSGGNTLIALGDSLTNTYANFAHPNWLISRDHDRELAAATRVRLLEMTSTDRIAVMGYHFPFPGIGHVQKAGDAYEFVPALWQF
jgi:glyoxylase-like metal-dependent hydrolase (beta-lactamase superfamily II)